MCVVSALNGLHDVIVGRQSVLLEGAVKAGVARFIPSDFSADFTRTEPGYNRNFDLRREFMVLADRAPIKTTSILNGAFMDMLGAEMPIIQKGIRRVLYWRSADQKLDLTTKDGKSQKVLIGDDTPTGNAVYAAVSGDPRVFTLASYAKSSLDKTATDLRDKRLLTVNFDKVSAVDLNAKRQSVEFGRSKDAWQIVKPRPLRADNFSVEDLVRRLKDAKMDLSASADADAKKLVAAFASSAPVATVKVTDATGTQTLEVRKNKTDYYAKSSAVAGV